MCLITIIYFGKNMYCKGTQLAHAGLQTRKESASRTIRVGEMVPGLTASPVFLKLSFWKILLRDGLYALSGLSDQ